MANLTLNVTTVTVLGRRVTRTINQHINKGYFVSDVLVVKVKDATGKIVTYNASVKQVGETVFNITVKETVIDGVTYAPIFVMGRVNLIMDQYNDVVEIRTIAECDPTRKPKAVVMSNSRLVGSCDINELGICKDVKVTSCAGYRKDVPVLSVKYFQGNMLYTVGLLDEKDYNSKVSSLCTGKGIEELCIV